MLDDEPAMLHSPLGAMFLFHCPLVVQCFQGTGNGRLVKGTCGIQLQECLEEFLVVVDVLLLHLEVVESGHPMEQCVTSHQCRTPAVLGDVLLEDIAYAYGIQLRGFVPGHPGSHLFSMSPIGNGCSDCRLSMSNHRKQI